MTHAAGHIICGGGGKKTGERKITINQHDVLDVAIRLNRDEAELAVAGYTPKQIRRIKRLGARINKHVHGWYEDLEKAGIDAHYYEPHPENLDEGGDS